MRNLKLPALAAVLLVASSLPSHAHHPLGGAPMTTFSDGVLSGIGHPILGFDHLFFICAVGIAALFTGRALVAPGLYIAGMLGGVGLILGGVALPMVEPVIALSLLIVGALIMSGRAMSLPVVGLLFAVLGVFHGWAFGESLAGQEGGAPMQVAVGYLLGLGVTQWLIAIAAGLVVSRGWRVASASDVPVRLAGGMVAGAGLFLTLEAIEGPVLAMLGLGAA